MKYNFSNKISSLKASAIREILKFTADPTVISFAAGNPAPEAFPTKEVAQISAQLLEESPIDALQYSITEGYPKLRNWLKDRLRKQNMFKDSDELIIVSGAQQGIELSCKVLCNEGDTVICEAPSFIGSLNSFKSYRTNLVGIPLKDDGMDIDKLESALKANPNTRFIYTIPNFQNPSGITTSLEKRKAIYALAKRYGVLILEDNPYGDLRYAGEDVPTIKSLDTDGIVIYCGSFSKVLAPGLRVGYVCAPAEIVQKIVVGKQVSDVHSNIWAQMICERFVTNYDFEAHLDKLRDIYKHKCNLMLSNLKFSLPTSISLTEPEGGLFIWATLPQGADMMAFCNKAVQEKVAVVPGNAFMVSESDLTTSFRLNFSTPSDEQILRGVEILGKVARELF